MKKHNKKLIMVCISIAVLIGIFITLIFTILSIHRQDVMDTAISKGASYKTVTEKNTDELFKLNKILPDKDDISEIDFNKSFAICFYKYTCPDCHILFSKIKTPAEITTDFSNISLPDILFIPVDEKKDGSEYFYINQKLTDVFKVTSVPSIIIYDKNKNNYTIKPIYTTNNNEVVLDVKNYNDLKKIYRLLN